MMINKIGYCIQPTARKISFGAKRNVQNENDVMVRNVLRDRIEGNFDASYNYLSEIDNLTAQQMRARLLRVAKSTRHQEEITNSQKTERKVDYHKLKQAIGNSGFVSAKRDNELYTGPRLNKYPNGIKVAKEAGINTIVSLETIDFGYGEEGVKEAKENDINLVGIKDIGNKTLFTFAVIPSASDAPLLNRLMDYPEAWATQDENGNIKENADKNILDAQELIDILNGKHKSYPAPVYYGCDYGTNRTYSWHNFYNILKDCDRTKPLDAETVEKLAYLYEDLKDLYRN
jgi:hypothetical protein